MPDPLTIWQNETNMGTFQNLIPEVLTADSTGQWQIQDFPKVEATTFGGTNIQFCQIFLKTAWNWKNLGTQGVCVPVPPVRSSAPMPVDMAS